MLFDESQLYPLAFLHEYITFGINMKANYSEHIKHYKGKKLIEEKIWKPLCEVLWLYINSSYELKKT